MTYSQNREDETICELFAGQQRGKVLDIGAYDGVTFSNTRALMERGWGGVLAEPEPAAFLKLLALYRDRDDVRLVNSCVGEEFYLSRFWHTQDMVGTTNEMHHEKWRDHGGYDGMYYVACVPIADLYACAEPDFVNIDVEGESARLAIYMLGRKLTPKVLCVEHDGQPERLCELGSVFGYRNVLCNAENLVLAR